MTAVHLEIDYIMDGRRPENTLSASLRRSEDDADRGEGIQDVAGRTQLAAPGIDTGDHYVVGILVGGEEIGARGVDGEVTRRRPGNITWKHETKRVAAWRRQRPGPVNELALPSVDSHRGAKGHGRHRDGRCLGFPEARLLGGSKQHGGVNQAERLGNA